MGVIYTREDDGGRAAKNAAKASAAVLLPVMEKTTRENTPIIRM